MYDYYLGGKDNFAADREAAERAAEKWTAVRVATRENRAFLGRAVSFAAGERGIRQFLDIGTGIPAVGNTHEVAQAIDPSCRIVYVDNDPIVLAHARALLNSTPQGRTAYLDADIRDPQRILDQARQVLDFDQPIALTLVAILHFLPDDWDPHGILRQLLEPLAPGSCLIATHVTPEYDPVGVETLARSYNDSGIPAQPRTLAEFQTFFDGLDIEPPGTVLVSEWRPADMSPRPSAAEVSWHGGVATKTS
jgi:hypothetical protein